MSEQTTNLILPYLAAGQAQKHVTVNEALRRLDALVQLAVVSDSTAAQPGSPTDGEVYILPSGKTGAQWGAMTNLALAYYSDGAWEEITPREGFVAYVKDADTLKAWDGSAWNGTGGGGSYTFSATDKVLGRVSSGGGAAEEVTFTDQAQQLCDDTSFSAMRATLGLGTSAVKNTGASGDAVPLLSGGATFAGDLGVTKSGVVTYEARRTSNTPGDIIGQVLFTANDSASSATPYALMRGNIVTATDGAEVGEYQFRTADGTGGTANRATISLGLTMTGASGGDKGSGTINATAVYDDNVLLTCGPLAFARDGAIDLGKWDALVPDRVHPAEFEDVIEEIPRLMEETLEGRDEEGRIVRVTRMREVIEQQVIGQREARPLRIEPRRHEVMRLFQTMLDEGFDPRDPENFCARMKADGAVPGLYTEAEWRAMLARGEKPDTGAALTRTFLALDNLAVAFAALAERVARLEPPLSLDAGTLV